MREAEELKITHAEVTKLREHIEQIDQWKARVSLFLEDDRDQLVHREVFTSLLRETALFKVDLALSEELQRRLEFIEWHAKVKGVFEADIVQIESIQNIVNEGSAKGFAEV